VKSFQNSNSFSTTVNHVWQQQQTFDIAESQTSSIKKGDAGPQNINENKGNSNAGNKNHMDGVSEDTRLIKRGKVVVHDNLGSPIMYGKVYHRAYS
jgi:hypothetical protein